jgi:hypothetical protein
MSVVVAGSLRDRLFGLLSIGHRPANEFNLTTYHSVARNSSIEWTNRH